MSSLLQAVLVFNYFRVRWRVSVHSDLHPSCLVHHGAAQAMLMCCRHPTQHQVQPDLQVDTPDMRNPAHPAQLASRPPAPAPGGPPAGHSSAQHNAAQANTSAMPQAQLTDSPAGQVGGYLHNGKGAAQHSQQQTHNGVDQNTGSATLGRRHDDVHTAPQNGSTISSNGRGASLRQH